MVNPFADLENALAIATGWDVSLAGGILGIVFTIVLYISLTWAISKKGHNLTFIESIICAGFGIVVATVVGWFDYWVPLFIIFLVIFTWYYRGER